MKETERNDGSGTAHAAPCDFMGPTGGRRGGDGFRRLAGSLVAHNPFYLVSACFFLYALTVMFGTDDIWIDTVVPLGLLAGYSLLTTATAVFVGRRRGVWDDARSLGLITVTLMMVLSVALDQRLMEHAGRAWLIGCGGLLFASSLSELLRMGLRLKVDLDCHLIYHAVLALFFIYPGLLAFLVSEHGQAAGIRAIICFPVAAGVLFLGLMGAVRRGADSARASGPDGAPWRWPWHPWSLFGVLAVAVCVRTYLMCISFHAGQGVGPYTRLETGFGMYMLLPFFAVLLTLFLEHAVQASNRRLQKLVLAGPAIFLLFALAAQLFHTKAALEFVKLAGMGTNPAFLIAALSSIAFLLYAVLRKVTHAEAALALTLAACALADNGTRFLASIGVPPLATSLTVASTFILTAARGGSSFWGMGGASIAAIALIGRYGDGWSEQIHSAAVFHSLYIAAFAGAMLSSDKAARLAQVLTAMALPPMFLAVLFNHNELAPAVPSWLITAYLLLLLGFSAVGYFIRKNKLYLYAGGANLGICCVDASVALSRLLASVKLAGLRPLLLCALAFAVAFAISLHKAGRSRQHATS